MPSKVSLDYFIITAYFLIPDIFLILKTGNSKPLFGAWSFLIVSLNYMQSQSKTPQVSSINKNIAVFIDSQRSFPESFLGISQNIRIFIIFICLHPISVHFYPQTYLFFLCLISYRIEFLDRRNNDKLKITILLLYFYQKCTSYKFLINLISNWLMK